VKCGMKLTNTKSYKELIKLKGHKIEDIETRLRDFEINLGAIRYNYGFSGVDEEIIKELLKLAEEQKLEEQRDSMFRGEIINESERRSVQHCAVRGKGIAPEIEEFVEHVRIGRIKGISGKRIKYAVNIGIGGSGAGVRLGVKALESEEKVIETLFLEGVDNSEIDEIFERIQVEETLFVIVSKTFATQETLMSALEVRKRVLAVFKDRYTEKEIIEKHFAAATSNEEKAIEFGIDEKRIFHIEDSIGGRFSVWSGAGICLALSIGAERFKDFLKGAAFIDKHFQEAPLEKNMPVMLGLIAVWHRNFEGYKARAVVPYAYELRELPGYLQQLEMESNGKNVTRSKEPADYETAPVVFGYRGTAAQHSFFQFLHQGTDIVPVDFIAINTGHSVLMENLAAQAAALAFGNKAENYEGGRPSNIITLAKPDAYHLGCLLALYEHMVFVEGILWDINSFDQPGVELGKKLAKSISGTDKKSVVENAAELLFRKLQS